jgi:tagatose 1,6-diphosphate aldolase
MSGRTYSEAKRARLRRLSDANGIIGAIAIDQRRSLRGLIAHAAGQPPAMIGDEQLITFKETISEVLSPFATAILFDTEYGLSAAAKRHSRCGLLLAYELDGYDNPRPHRMLALMPELSVQRLAEMGADGVKILLHYSPEDPSSANQEKFAVIERIGAECEAHGLPFFLEPVLYDASHPVLQTGISADQRTEQLFEFARKKPQLIVDMMREFSRERYLVDILKVEFPVVAQFVDGSKTFSGRPAYSYDQAVEWYRRADAAAGLPYIYLSAGVSTPEFQESLRIGLEAGTSFSGVLCGRATWQDGITVFVQQGREGFRAWLEKHGVSNIEALNRLIAGATPWQQSMELRQAR